jgi:AcrR family transcriptional regulator
MQYQRSEETRRKILSTSLALFAQAGYNATGVAEICQAAGVSKGAFYHHFPSKQAVFLTLLQEWIEDLDRNLTVVRAGHPNVALALMDMANHIHGVFQDAGGRLPMFLEFWTQASHDPEVWKATIQPYQRFQAFFANLIREGIADGSLKRDIDPEIGARTIVSMAVGLLLQGVLDPHGARWEEVAQQSMHLLIVGLARSPE